MLTYWLDIYTFENLEQFNVCGSININMLLQVQDAIGSHIHPVFTTYLGGDTADVPNNDGPTT